MYNVQKKTLSESALAEQNEFQIMTAIVRKPLNNIRQLGGEFNISQAFVVKM